MNDSLQDTKFDLGSNGKCAGKHKDISEQAKIIQQAVRGMHITHYIELSKNMDLFTLAAQDKYFTPETISQKSHLDLAYIEKWCETGYALGIFDWNVNDGYTFAEHMDELLGKPESSKYMGNYTSIHLMIADLYRNYGACFKNGHSLTYDEFGTDLIDMIGRACSNYPRTLIENIIAPNFALKSSLEKGGEILDVGCGCGYSFEPFLKNFGQSHIKPSFRTLKREICRDEYP